MTTQQTLSSAVKVATDAANTATGQANIATLASKAAQKAQTQVGVDSGAAQAAASVAREINNRLYPGTYAADPIQRPDGSAMQNGDVALLTSGVMRVRIAGAWQDWTTASGAAATAAATLAQAWADSAGLPDGVNKSAKSYATDAAAQAVAAAASRTAMDSRVYPGTYGAPPATRPDASARVAGDMYFAADGSAFVYSAVSGWVIISLNSASLAATGGSALVGYDGGTVQDVLDGAKALGTYAALRAYTGRATAIRITAVGMAGYFQRDDADAASADNSGTILIDGSARRWKRVYSGPLSLAWFKTTADAGAAMQSAINALGAAGGEIVVPGGAWAWQTVPKLPRALTGFLSIVGYGATITLSAAAPRAFDLDYTADHQTFKNYRVAGFLINAAGTVGATGANHVLVGSREGAVWRARFNASNWLFEDIRIDGIPQHAGVGTVFQGVVTLTPLHAAADEATQNTITGITFRNVVAYGGDGGFQINAFTPGGVATSANVFFDEINVIDCAHYLTTPTPGPFACSHVHIGGFGFGNRCRVLGFKGTGSGDNGVEINAMQDSFVHMLDFEGFQNYGLFAMNYHVAQNVEAQRFSAGQHNYRLTFFGSRAFSFSSESTVSNPFGVISLGDMSVHAVWWGANGTALLLQPNGAGTKTCKAVKVNSLTFTADMNGQVVGSNFFAAAVSINLGQETPVHIGKFTARIYGAPTLGGANNFPRLVELYGNVRYTCLDADVNCEVPFANWWVNYVTSAAATISAKLGAQNYKSSAATTICFRIEQTPFDATHRLQVTNSILSGGDVFFATPAQREFASFVGTTFATPQGVGTQAAGASPWVYVNNGFREVSMALIGGTISQVDVSVDGGTTWLQVGSSGNQIIRLPHWWQARVTHTVAPTVRTIPYPA